MEKISELTELNFRASINEAKNLIKVVKEGEINEETAGVIKLVLAEVENILEGAIFESVGDKLEELYFYQKELEKQEKNSEVIMQEVAKIKDKIKKIEFIIIEGFSKNIENKKDLEEIKTILKNLETITIDA